MRGDWLSEAMEYRDVDKAAQEQAEAAMNRAPETAIETLASVSAVPGSYPGEPCPSCGGPVARKRGGKKTKVYCSDRCEYRAWVSSGTRVRRVPGQASLPFTPPSQPVRGLTDPPRDEHGRLARSCALILGRLQVGPATGLELLQAGGGVRYSARILELKKRGHVIEAEPLDKGRGVWIYRLVQEG